MEDEKTIILKPGESMHDYKVPKESVVEPKKIFNKREIFEMSKQEQVKLLKEYGIELIPRFETERVEKILELQQV